MKTYNGEKMNNEYNKDVNSYQSSGKKFNNERGIISLTSWKARIGTVGKTLYNLVTVCPGFHIVLVLSEEEFPRKEKELPEDLMLFVDNDLIEILWVYRNYKAFKKVLFTMDKYRDVPVISADDDCIYLKNYAEEFYNIWEKNRDCFVSIYGSKRPSGIYHTGGAATLYPPYVFKEYGIKCLSDKILNYTNQDDDYYTCLKEKMGLNKSIIIECHGGWKKFYVFHDDVSPLHKEIHHKDASQRKEEFNFISKNIIL